MGAGNQSLAERQAAMMARKAERGRRGRKSGGEPTVVVYLRMPREWARRLHAQAAAEDRSLNNYIVRVLHLARLNRKPFPSPRHE